MSKVTNFICLSVGVAIGAASTWIFLKKRYEQIANEEIESVKEAYRTDRTAEDILHEDHDTDWLEETRAYVNITNNYNGKGEQKQETPTQEAEVIPPDEFGENEEYETFSLSLYEDGTLLDESGDIIVDKIAFVGTDFEDWFGEWEDDSVYVRNDTCECYFEILKVEGEYLDSAETVG